MFKLKIYGYEYYMRFMYLTYMALMLIGVQLLYVGQCLLSMIYEDPAKVLAQMEFRSFLSGIYFFFLKKKKESFIAQI